MPNENKVLLMQMESGHIYKVIKDDGQLLYLERAYNYLPTVGKYKKGDEYALRIGYTSFRTKFRVLSDDEESRIPMAGAGPAEASGGEGGAEKEKEEESSNIIYKTTERDSFSNLILNPDVLETIEVGLKRIENREILENVWGLGDLRPMKGKIAMNFWGPPGTGKTMAARAVARKMEKDILQVDYANMISKWVGDTAKHIREAFVDAKKRNAVLFFDEADSMLSKRMEMADDGHSNSINQNRNVLMQELDRFDSVVIFATNFFKNYDEALLRRIASHVKFELPNEESRTKILQLKIPKKAIENGKVDKDIDMSAIAKQTEGFSGSDLENTVANAIEYCAMKDLNLTQSQLEVELKKIQKSKSSHGTTSKKSMGILQR